MWVPDLCRYGWFASGHMKITRNQKRTKRNNTQMSIPSANANYSKYFTQIGYFNLPLNRKISTEIWCEAKRLLPQTAHREKAAMQSNNRKPHFSTNDKQNRKWHTHKRQREKPEIMKPAADSTKATKNILLLHKHTKNDIKRKQITKYY